MATITKRELRCGDTVYRVRLRYKHLPEFSLNFDTWDSACDWVEKNEVLFLECPDKYFEWKIQNCYDMRRMRVNVKDHVVLTKKRSILGDLA